MTIPNLNEGSCATTEQTVIIELMVPLIEIWVQVIQDRVEVVLDPR